MPRHDDNRPGLIEGLIEGPIEDLLLPSKAWNALQRENIRTLDQLRALAGRIERFEGVGRKTALAIREELARVRSLEDKPSDEGWSPGHRSA
jgi:DNA-directed RNA polymerase alpha subunit